MSGDDEELARRAELKAERKRAKRGEGDDLLKTLEEVFDRKTVMALYELVNKGPIERVFGAVKAGKESRIYWAEGKGGEELAVKIFLTSSMEFKSSMRQYIQGDPRFKIGKDYRQIVYTWARKEYRNLEEARGAGVDVPRPIAVNQNIVVMEFIGEKGVPAPLLKQLQPGDFDRDLFLEVMAAMKRLYRRAGLVHSDLSEYNIMVWGSRLCLIDFGQAVSVRHPMAEEFLRRDVGNLIRFFRRMGVDTGSEEEAISWLKTE
ncbi:MAG: serine protein kinase RIO [Candidatus Methanomethylicia archaeon]|nr:serine protein kinase RIO [Candidatus Methanomethylicia archaeon]